MELGFEYNLPRGPSDSQGRRRMIPDAKDEVNSGEMRVMEGSPAPNHRGANVTNPRLSGIRHSMLDAVV